MEASFKLYTITEYIQVIYEFKILPKSQAFPASVFLFNKQLVLIIVQRQTCKKWNEILSSINLKILSKSLALPV